MNPFKPRRRILVIAPTDWDREELSHPRYRDIAEIYFDDSSIYRQPVWLLALTFDALRQVRRLVRKCRDLRIGGVIGTHDYPGCLIAAAVAKELGFPSPTPEAVLLCSHKFLSREAQKRVVPEVTPDFFLIDPRKLDPASVKLPYPFFVKPVKGTLSYRASRVNSFAELTQITRFSPLEWWFGNQLIRPFEQLQRIHLPKSIGAAHFIGERLLGGHQITLDGFVSGGKATVMGIVDSVMFPGTISFRRFVYPSLLPSGAQARMGALAIRVMEGIGFDHACFNIEMFHDPESDAIHIIEINPRMSYQFSDLYEKVDGANTYGIQLALAAGSPPEFVRGAGRYGAAASFVLRRFRDARVLRVPSPEEIRVVEIRFPDTRVQILTSAGKKLSSELQDAASFRYGLVNMGGRDHEDLLANYAEVERLLPFEFFDYSNSADRHSRP